MKNILVKQMIESITPKKDEWFDNIFPWTPDFMCPLSIRDMQRDKRIMRKLEKRVSEDVMNEINAIIKDVGGWGKFCIVRENPCPVDDFNDDLNREDQLGRYWINEHENGGYSGDSFSGYCFIKVSSKDYLSFWYQD